MGRVPTRKSKSGLHDHWPWQENVSGLDAIFYGREGMFRGGGLANSSSGCLTVASCAAVTLAMRIIEAGGWIYRQKDLGDWDAQKVKSIRSLSGYASSYLCL